MKSTSKNKPYKLKRVVIMLWILSVSPFLWYFSLSIKAEVSFFQFMNFLTVLIGSGFAYHVLTALINYPYNEENTKKWKIIMKSLIFILFCYIFIAVGIFTGTKLGNSLGYIITYFSLIIGMLSALNIFINLSFKLKDIIKL